MGLPVLLIIRSVWRTLHQPIVEVSEVVLEDVDAAEEVVVAEAVVEAEVAAVVAVKMKKNGSPSPSLAVWSRMARSKVLKKSTFSLCPSKNSKSSTSSSEVR